MALTLEKCDQEPLLGEVTEIMEFRLFDLRGIILLHGRFAMYSDPQNR